MIFYLFFITFLTISPQFSSDGEWVQLFMDHYGDEWQEDEFEEILIKLSEIEKKPHPVRELNVQKLSELPFLTELVITAILNWISTSDELTYNRLESSGIIGPVESELIRYFVVFEHVNAEITELSVVRSKSRRVSLPKINTDFRFKTTTPTATGFNGSTPTYLGNKNRIEDRIWITDPNISMHLSRSKLPGENRSYPTQSGFRTAHIRLINPMKSRNRHILIEDVIIGDYQIRMGHGLIAKNGTMRSGTESLSNQSGILTSSIPYRSPTSGKFLRGMVTQVKIVKPVFQFFYSNRDLSASSDDDTFYLPGWVMKRTTLSEVERYQNISLRTIGLTSTLDFRIRSYHANISTTMIKHAFTKRISNRAGYFNSFAFSGSQSQEFATFFAISSNKWAYSTEFAVLNGLNYAYLQRINFKRDELTTGVWYRFYSPGFRSILGAGPAAMGGSNNEVGLGFWLKYRLSGNQQLYLLADSYKSIVPRSGSMMPVHGANQTINYLVKIGRTSLLDFRIRRRSQLSGYKNITAFERESYDRQKIISQSFQFTFRYSPARNLLIHTKVDYNITKSESGSESGTGIGISQLIRYSFNLIDVYASHMVFNTDDFTHRVFNYEYDLMQSFSIPSFYGNGQRSYLMLHISPFKQVIIRFKIGYTTYVDRYVIGSGNDQINQNYRFDYGLQVRLSL